LLGAAVKALISGKSGADVATPRADGKDRLREKARDSALPWRAGHTRLAAFALKLCKPWVTKGTLHCRNHDKF
jgi:hypothetical protein